MRPKTPRARDEESYDRRCIMALTVQQMQPVAHRYTARGVVTLERLETVGATRKSLGVSALATCPPRPLCGMSGATQHASRCNHPHTPQTGPLAFQNRPF